MLSLNVQEELGMNFDKSRLHGGCSFLSASCLARLIFDYSGLWNEQRVLYIR